jgi:hypothetical protein
MAPQAATPQYPLYNTTFSLYRLNIDIPLENDVLQQHARQFRDILAGEVLRGVRVNLAPQQGALAGVGALQTVMWKPLLEEEAWNSEDMTQVENDNTTVTLVASRGTIVTVTYEQAIYKAILLRDDRGNMNESVLTMREDLGGPQRFPLMLTKMTPPLREAFITYLTEAFDTRISPLYLSSGFLIDAMEKYISEVSVGEDDETMELLDRSKSLRRAMKDVIVTVGFDLPGGQLKSIDINITKEDLPQMVVRGERLGKEEAGKSPFFDALAKYAKKHLALDLNHESVKILRLACAAFVIGAGEGRIKITQPFSDDDGHNPQSRATRRLVHGLITAAANGLLNMEAKAS